MLHNIANSINFRKKYQNAFTILELLIVFFFFALLSGLAMPNLTNAYRSWQHRLTLDDLLLKVNRLSLSAIESRKQIILTNSQQQAEYPFTVPQDWELSVSTPIYYYPNGVCSGGLLTIKSSGIENKYDLQAPYCSPKEI